MTGVYHRPVQRAFRKAGSETRLVHPFASRHYRLPAHADTKTDDHDLEGIFRATVNGFGLLEAGLGRDSTASCSCWRGIGAIWWKSVPSCNARSARSWNAACRATPRCSPTTICGGGPRPWRWLGVPPSPEAICQAGIPGVTQWLAEEKLRMQTRTVARLVAWAGGAAEADPLAQHLTRIWLALYEDWQAKTRQIQRVEEDLAEILVKTPYLLLLSHPGINVVSAAELAGEMGPIEHYAHAKAITGRAGLFPSRYQSDQVDRADGPLARFRNARLRAAWMRVADNLLKYNAHYHGMFQLWKQRGVDARDIRCRIANRATRTVFQMVSGRRLYDHPSRLDRQYVLDKLLAFHREHETPPPKILRDLHQAVAQIPPSHHADEALPLQRIYQRAHRSRRAGPQAIGEILLVVLARLGVGKVQSESEAPSPHANLSDTST